MISRRRFIAGSITAAVSVGLQPRPLRAHTQTRPTLRVFFVGGSVFRRDGSNCLAVQPSGKDCDGKRFTHPEHGYDMTHRSFMVVPAGFIDGAEPFEKDYPSKDLHRDLKQRDRWRVICLEGKDIQITHRGQDDFAFRCEEAVDYHWLASNWKLRGTWTDLSKKIGPEVSSRIHLTGGVLTDGDVVNKKGYGERWVVGNGPGKKLSDVAVLTLTAPEIRLGGISSQSKLVEEDTSLYVFSGPEHQHGQEGQPFEYGRIEHALLLNTLYDTGGADVRPKTYSGKKIKDTAKKQHTHPCDFGRQNVQRQRTFRAPPDSEYCANYNHLP